MEWYFILLIAVLGAALLFGAYLLIGGFIAYRMTFYHDPKKDKPDPYRFLKGDGSERDEKSRRLIDEILSVEFRDVYTESHEGLKLHGYMHYREENERFAILFHGYKSTPFTDFSGGALLLMRMGYNIIMVDQRAHGLSEGKTLSFGALESRDAVAWAKFVEESLGKVVPTALVGISMGAGTVILAAKDELPEGVFAAIADCPFSSAMGIIRRVAKKNMGIPSFIAAPIVKVGARLFGKFSVGDAVPRRAASECKIPLLLIHGDGDNFVPIEMSYEILEASRGAARLASFPDATHGTSYIYDTERYEKITSEFLKEAYERKFSAK